MPPRPVVQSLGVVVAVKRMLNYSSLASLRLGCQLIVLDFEVAHPVLDLTLEIPVDYQRFLGKSEILGSLLMNLRSKVIFDRKSVGSEN